MSVLPFLLSTLALLCWNPATACTHLDRWPKTAGSCAVKSYVLLVETQGESVQPYLAALYHSRVQNNLGMTSDT
jgi:hypothetical protein